MKANTVHRLVRLCLVVTVVLMLAGADVIAHAQQAACLGLKADDCQLLANARRVTLAALLSYNIDYDVNFKVAGTPDGDIALTLHGTGPVDTNGADVRGLAGQGASPSLTKLANVLSKLILGTTLDLETVMKGKDTKLHIEVRLLNNTLYFNSPTITKGGWKSIDLKPMIDGLNKMASNALATDKTQPAATPPAISAETLKEFQTLGTIEGLLTAERGPDLTVGKDVLAAFIIHVDLQKVLTWPDLIPLIKSSQAKSAPDKQMTDDQIKAMLAQVSTAIKDLKISFTRYVGVTDRLPHGGSFDITGQTDLSGLKDLAPNTASKNSSAAAALSGPIGLDIHLKVVLSAIGEKANLTAPADAQPFKGGDSSGSEATPNASAAG